MSASELLDQINARPMHSIMSDTVPGFLFDNCFRDRSITVIIAPAHRGKTMLMLDMAICLDMELPLFGRFRPIKGQEVFFLGCDAPSWDYGLQSRKLCIGHGLDASKRELLGINGVWRRGFAITDKTSQDWLKRWRDETGASILFIDSHRATHRADENSSTEMVAVWNILCGMRDYGWSIIMSHHAGKPKEVMATDVHTGRGSSIIGDSADFIYNLYKRSRKDTRVSVSCVKGRGSAGDDEPFNHFEMLYTPSNEYVNGKALSAIALVSPPASSEAGILEFLSTGPQNRADIGHYISTVMGAETRTMQPEAMYKYVDNRLSDLREKGKVVNESRGLWRLT